MQAPGRLEAADVPAWLESRRAQGLPSVQLLDVREPWEREVASMAPAGSVLVAIPMGQLVARMGELDPQRPVLALCHHGMRSLQCVAFLSRQGFQEVYNLEGGIDRWSREVDRSVPNY